MSCYRERQSNRAALFPGLNLKDYNPNQPRDYHGRWTSGNTVRNPVTGKPITLYSLPTPRPGDQPEETPASNVTNDTSEFLAEIAASVIGGLANVALAEALGLGAGALRGSKKPYQMPDEPMLPRAFEEPVPPGEKTPLRSEEFPYREKYPGQYEAEKMANTLQEVVDEPGRWQEATRGNEQILLEMEREAGLYYPPENAGAGYDAVKNDVSEVYRRAAVLTGIQGRTLRQGTGSNWRGAYQTGRRGLLMRASDDVRTRIGRLTGADDYVMPDGEVLSRQEAGSWYTGQMFRQASRYDSLPEELQTPAEFARFQESQAALKESLWNVVSGQQTPVLSNQAYTIPLSQLTGPAPPPLNPTPARTITNYNQVVPLDFTKPPIRPNPR